MDIRGIEVTNQLRSAIRAKLLELGVRYDEELPDYILVMVVNKKSRQQMHNDLHLFLESSTTPFVEWLHDQVLKKLQKVTVAKKKSLREFVPTVVVKQEEERKKRKISTTSFLEDVASEPTKEKLPAKPVAKPNGEKQVYKETLKSTSSQKLESSQKSSEKCAKVACREAKSDSLLIEEQELVSKQAVVTDEPSATGGKSTISQEPVFKKLSEAQYGPKVISIQPQGVKRPLESFPSVLEHRESSDKRQLEAKRSKLEEEKQETLDESSKKLKSCVNKPKITSVVSVKNRLGLISPRKKFEVYREKLEMEGRHRASEKRRFEASRNGNFQRRNFEEERSRRELKLLDPEKSSDIKTRLGLNKESKEKIVSTLKPKLLEKPVGTTVGTVKDRLGLMNITKSSRQTNKLQDTSEFRSFKSLEQDRESNLNVKNRLGLLKNNFRPLEEEEEEEDSLNLAEEDDSEETQQSGINSGPIKSHIIAVNRGAVLKPTKKKMKLPDRTAKDICSDTEDNVEDTKIPSKVIVTPRPLKPLQPAQKRATQSLLFRAVAEANQSVVTQTNPDPSLLEKKAAALKRCKVVPMGDVGQNLSVHLNASKRLVMEKIQVELNTDAAKSEPKQYVPQPITDEHMGVVMSLFQRSDNNQKFLVTLNGYNNNLSKEKSGSDDEEQLEMEVTEDDEMALLATQAEPESTVFRITDTEEDGDSLPKSRCEENNENRNTENVEKQDDSPRKRRKLSPIVYNRAHSQSPELKSSTNVATASVPTKNKKSPLTENSLTSAPDKSKERCRYWPTCTLGSKCAYMHPPVMCSVFPACKFGEKCAYRHPKCKFGLSCTKLGCIFSHRAHQQCKYHPFCTKPSCPYSHPASTVPVGPESTSQRAKFTWRRRN